MKMSLIHQVRHWLCLSLFEDVIDEIMDDSDSDLHKELDKLGIPKSRIQPTGPCYDGLIVRVRDAMNICDICGQHPNAPGSGMCQECGDRLNKCNQKLSSHTPVHCEDGQWWFWDETWSNRYGPYSTQEEANKALKVYVGTVLQ